MQTATKRFYRSKKQLWNHYLIEKSLADRLKMAPREERKALYTSMYDELFERVPDHPRLNRRCSNTQIFRSNRRKMVFLSHYLRPETRFAEFGAGDCEFCFLVSQYVSEAIAIDISDQIAAHRKKPSNFRQVIYDGLCLQEVADNYIDVLFSNQLIEHLHPEDTVNHFRTAHRILKPGGVYALKTPHAMSGPHDISKYFSDKPKGFHLKEWTYHELSNILSRAGFAKYTIIWTVIQFNVPVSKLYVYGSECLLPRMPASWTKRLSGLLLPTISVVAVK